MCSGGGCLINPSSGGAAADDDADAVGAEAVDDVGALFGFGLLLLLV